MNHEHLKTFVTVANHKSFSEAARILFLSQPTITSQIKSLERSLNTSLFNRTSKYVEMTPAAKILYSYAQEILDLQVKAQNEIDELLEDLHGKLIVASSLTIGEHLLPMFLYDFKKKYPKVDLSTDITNSQHIVDMVKSDELEIGLIEAALDDPLLHVVPFMSDELVLVAYRDFFSSDRQEVKLTELRSLPIVLRERGSGTRTVAHQHLGEHDVHPDSLNVVLELGSTESVKTAVEAGLGVSILSKSAIRKELDAGLFKTYPIENVELKRSFYVVYKKKKTLSLISQKFTSLILEKND
ncbi:selenium metabolism-associated LysR family transcriptional regulator [Texcoconibacillus texcoconensis]|uniref:DNA-binding transcriptional LysR family regulator n=1 Tax=Texcoconibacillus texcoconensis TaxID=1095777 RepID=A0A840QMK6_9BACI|nr:selenium metabolism-associated LysR family transcriptional regulator [Texcoconibacillus texcoconensis]MBB5172586.1 DNA-binding transcriptional LysR family regulator [Texcoconibacillus texcoconensis]